MALVPPQDICLTKARGAIMPSGPAGSEYHEGQKPRSGEAEGLSLDEFDLDDTTRLGKFIAALGLKSSSHAHCSAWRNCEHFLLFVRSAGMFSSVHVTTLGVDSKLLLPDLSAIVKSGQDGFAFLSPKRSGSIRATAARVSGNPTRDSAHFGKVPHNVAFSSISFISDGQYATFVLDKLTT